MSTLFTRTAVAGALLLSLSQAGGEAAQAQQSGGTSGARYAAIARGADHVLLLDQFEGIIYHCPTAYETRCFRRSHVDPQAR